MIAFGKLAMATVILASGATIAKAQSEFPTRTIRFIVPFPPGGGNDILARVIAAKLSASFKQPVIVENRPGAGGNIGADIVAQSTPDGHTVLLGTNTLAINPHIQKSVPFDVRKDLVSVARLASTPFVLAVPAKSPIMNVADLVAAAKARPGRITYASVGIGTPHHLGMELLKIQMKVDLTHVPYKGSVAALSDLSAGEVQSMLVTINSALPFVNRKEIRVLGVAEQERLPSLPNIPTLRESGVPEFEVTAWYGLMVRAGTPPPVVRKLSEASLDALRQPDAIEQLQTAGFVLTPGGADQMQQVLLQELDKWAVVVREARILPE